VRPGAPQALQTAATPSGLARETHHGVNAFVPADAAGMRQPFRFRINPTAGTRHLTAENAAEQPPGQLIDEPAPQPAQAPARFSLAVQLAERGGPIDDATKPWRADRKLVDLGTITMTRSRPTARRGVAIATCWNET
jgi:catalase